MIDRVFNKRSRCRQVCFLAAICCCLILMMNECNASAMAVDKDDAIDLNAPITRMLQNDNTDTDKTPIDDPSTKEKLQSDGGETPPTEENAVEPVVSPLPEEEVQVPVATPVKNEEEEPPPTKPPLSEEVVAPVSEPASTKEETGSSNEEAPAADTPAETPTIPPTAEQEPDGTNENKSAPVETKPAESSGNEEASAKCEKKKTIEKCNKHSSCTWDATAETCLTKDPNDESSKVDNNVAPQPTPTKLPTKTPTLAPITVPTDLPAITPKKESITERPVAPPTKAPVKSEVVPNDEDDACGSASTCKSCKEIADTVEDETDSDETCQWKENKCLTIKMTDVAEDAPDECPDTNRNKTPNESNLEPTEDVDTLFTINAPLRFVLGTLVILLCCGITIRRCRTKKPNGTSYGRVGNNNFYASSFPPSNHISTSVKYEGVNTVPDDEDPEWDWPQRNDTPNVGNSSRSSSGSSPRHRGSSSSPPFGSYNHSNVSSGNSTSLPMDNHVSPRTEKKGFSVKKSGMNNPLHSNVAKQSSQLPPQLPPATIPNRSNHNGTTGPVVRKPMAPPSTNDFFAEMGLEAKPKFGPSTSTAPNKKRLGAVALPVDTSKDTWDDDDLDDLLD